MRRKAWYRVAAARLTLAMNATDDNSTLRVGDVRRRFDRAAASFDDTDFVHRVSRDGLLARIHPMSIDVKTVIDLGSATGAAVRPLEKRFRGAKVIAIDLSGQMLAAIRRKRSWLSKAAAVQADARLLPFADASVDVVFSNLLLPWIDKPAAVFGEINRVLRKDGLFAFATLGPDSLLALRHAWRSADDGAHVNRFPDMHDVGDALVSAGLRDPVLDVDRLSVTYESSDALFRDLTATGARNSLQQRERGLVGRQRFAKMTEALIADTDGVEIALELELVYGHCWGRGPQDPAGGFAVDPSNIPLRRR